MPPSEPVSSIEITSDAELVAACLSGDRHAFGRIVERYQRLLCSLAYSATGQFSQSEDVAQETFVDAWLQLSALREPEKLRPYREHRSVEHVAAALDLTEANMKQRLMRGRKILREQVLAFVEGALVRSTPGKVFTIGVLAALPELATPAKAVTVGVVAIHGGAMVKSTGIAALLGSVSGVVATVLTLRANLDQARTARERRAVVKATLGFFSSAMGFLVVLYLLRGAALRWEENRLLFAGLCQVLVRSLAGSQAGIALTDCCLRGVDSRLPQSAWERFQLVCWPLARSVSA